MTHPQPDSAAPHQVIAESADRLAKSATQQEDSADRRTQLAADRTVLAAERTYAAWVRTGLAALASGIGARSLLHGGVPDWLGKAAGGVLVLFAGFCFIAAVWRQMLAVAPRPDTPRLPGKLLIVVNGFLLLVCLSALAGILL